jgi:mycobactin phenyloxazoline synthetase
VITVDDLRALVGEIVGAEAGAAEADAFLPDHGLDSVRLMAIVERVCERGVAIEFEDLAEEPSYAAWAEVLDELVAR